MKNLLLIMYLLLFAVADINAQTSPVISDSVENKSINVYNPASVSEQTVSIADTNAVSPGQESGVVSSYVRNTERVRLYSGSHEGNNVVRIIEVMLPEKK